MVDNKTAEQTFLLLIKDYSIEFDTRNFNTNIKVMDKDNCILMFYDKQDGAIITFYDRTWYMFEKKHKMTFDVTEEFLSNMLLKYIGIQTCLGTFNYIKDHYDR